MQSTAFTLLCFACIVSASCVEVGVVSQRLTSSVQYDAHPTSVLQLQRYGNNFTFGAGIVMLFFSMPFALASAMLSASAGSLLAEYRGNSISHIIAWRYRLTSSAAGDQPGYCDCGYGLPRPAAGQQRMVQDFSPGHSRHHGHGLSLGHGHSGKGVGQAAAQRAAAVMV